jgi:hypothetical protein
MKRVVVFLLAASFVLPVALAVAGDDSARPAQRGSQALGGCALLPHDDAFHRKVTKLKALKGSSKMIAAIGGSNPLHPDFGRNPHYGIPYTVVGPGQRDVKVRVRRGSGYPGQSDKGKQPIPPNAKIEGGKRSNGDRHTLVVQRGKGGKPCKLTELYRAKYDGGNGHRWSADQLSVFNLSHKLPQRPRGWTSADAAGLPILPGLVRYGEVRAGRVNHAIRITFDQTRAAYRLPATHFASDSCSAKLPAMGDRLRLKRGFSLSGFSHDSRAIATALKRYGAIVADNGSDFYIGGATDGRWNDDHLNDLKGIPGRAFQFVDTGKRLIKSGSC